MKMTELRAQIEKAWENRELLKESKTQNSIREVINLLDVGTLRCAEPTSKGWQINEWVKKAVVLYFPIQKMETLEAGIFEYHDKMPLKRGYAEKGIRVVPNAVARHGAFIASGTILMPSYVNIGAYVDEGTMVDTWATVGSRCIVVEGVHVEKEAVLGANVVLTGSTKIIDVTGDKPIERKGLVPARSVVIPGSYTKKFPAGDYNVPCALIIGKRKESTNKKTSLNDAHRRLGGRLSNS